MRFSPRIVTLAMMPFVAAGAAAHGATLYATSFDTDALYRIDTQAGTVEAIGALRTAADAPVDFNEGGLALNAAGTLYGAFTGDLDGLFTIDPGTGIVDFIGPFDPGVQSDVSGIAFSRTGTLFGIDADSESLFTINPATGAAAVFGDGDTGLPSIGAVGGMSFSADGTLYATDSGNGSLYAFLGIGSGDDTASIVGSLGLARPAGMTFALDDDGVVKLFVVDSGVTTELYMVDLDSWTVDPVALDNPFPEGIGGLAAVIPEPASVAFLAVGGFAALQARRRAWR